MAPERVDNMPALIGVAVTGAVLLMSGELLSFVTGVAGLPGPMGLPHPTLVGGVLTAAGLFCGGVLVAMSAPGRSPTMSARRSGTAAGAGRGGRRRKGRGGPPEGGAARAESWRGAADGSQTRPAGDWFSQASPAGPVEPSADSADSAADWLSDIRRAGPVVPRPRPPGGQAGQSPPAG